MTIYATFNLDYILKNNIGIIAMLTLNITPQQQIRIEQASKRAKMTIEQYIISMLPDDEPNETHHTELDSIFGRYHHYAKGKTSVEQMNESIAQYTNEKWANK